MVSTSPPRSRSPPPEGGSASHQLRTYVRIRIWNFAWGFRKYTFVPYVRTYVRILPEAPGGAEWYARAYYRARAAKHHTYLPFHLRTYLHVRTVSPTYVRTYLHLRTVRTYRFTHVLYIPYRTHTYVRIVSPTYVRTYVSTYGTYVRTYSFSHVRTCGPCFIYVRTSLHASEPTATARGDLRADSMRRTRA